MPVSLLEEITCIDDYGFQIKPWYHWLPESREDELKRLEMNQAFFKEFTKGGHRFPAEIITQRDAEFNRIRELKQFIQST